MINLQFLAVDNGEDLDRDKFSGIIGLSPSKVGAKGLSGFLTQVQAFKVVSPVFSFYLTKNGNQGSKITFDGYNLEKFGKKGATEADVTWISIDPENQSYWSLPLSEKKISLGSNYTAITSSNVILDSGLSYALIPSKDIHAISSLLQSMYGIECTMS